MTDIIYDFISTGVDLILVGSVLSAMIIMMRGSTQLTTLISNQQIVTEEFDYYLQYHMYDNQEGLSAADALSAMVGNRFDLIVCIKDNTDPANPTYYMNYPENGKYYKVSGDSEGKSMAECGVLCTTSGTQLDYKTLASEEALSPDGMYKAYIMGLEGGVLKKVTFSRDTIIVGLYFEKYNP